MTHPTPAPAADWTRCRVVLPSPENWLVLDLASPDPAQWARSAAHDRLADDAPLKWRAAFAEDVLWYWVAAARQSALCAGLLAPPDSAVLASYCVRELHVAPGLLSMEALRAEAERAEGPFFQPQDISEVDLPLGPALRVRRVEPTAPESDGGEVVEGVAHYVLPREHETALECRLLWASLGLGEELGRMADELAASLRLL